jgi:hypothetical protein
MGMAKPGVPPGKVQTSRLDVGNRPLHLRCRSPEKQQATVKTAEAGAD